MVSLTSPGLRLKKKKELNFFFHLKFNKNHVSIISVTVQSLNAHFSILERNQPQGYKLTVVITINKILNSLHFLYIMMKIATCFEIAE